MGRELKEKRTYLQQQNLTFTSHNQRIKIKSNCLFNEDASSYQYMEIVTERIYSFFDETKVGNFSVLAQF